MSTAEAFPAYSANRAGLSTVCRSFGTPGFGVNSHFYTAFDFECASVKQLAGWIFEANAFYIAADVAQCPASKRPVYTTTAWAVNPITATRRDFHGEIVDNGGAVLACVPL